MKKFFEKKEGGGGEMSVISLLFRVKSLDERIL